MNKFLFIMIILMQSCFSEKDLEMSGQWKFLNRNNDRIIKPFDSFCPTSYPDDFSCYEIVYIKDNQIEHPLMIGEREFKASDKYIGYEFAGDMIKLSKDSLSFEYDWQISGNQLCLNRGEFCLERLDGNITTLDSTIFKFQVVQEEFPSYTVWLNYHYLQKSNTCEIVYNEDCEPYERIKLPMPEDEMSYIVKLLGRIPDEQLNRIYNNGLSDCSGISIDFYTANGNWKGIETCDLTMENPFEIRALATNMLWIMNRYVRKI